MDSLDPIDEQLQQLLERPEPTWEQGIAELCAQGDACATEIRRRFDLLRSSGFVGLERSGPVEPVFPERLGGFQLLERLGQGGMGVVFAAREERLGRTVALKLVRPEQLYFAGARERFQREVSAVAKLSHPGIVSVFSVGDEQGLPYFAMELLRGASLDDVLRALAGRQVESLSGADLWAVVARQAGVASPQFLEEPFTGPWTEVCAGIARRVAEALAHAHQNGVVHRDIKPSNVIVTPEGRVVLLDFGLARPSGVERVTRAGGHVGSLPYMAPEQLRGEAGDERTDVYGLGVLLRELLTLRQPFLSPSSETTRTRILRGEGAALELGNRAASWELVTVCAMATEPEPRRRYAAAADFGRDLENVRQRRPIHARPAGALRRLWRWTERRPALATGLLVGLLAAIGTPTAIAIGIAAQRDRARTAEAAQQQKTYQANIAAANAALQAHDAPEVRRRLEDCPADLRGFEWNHLALALDGSLLTLRGHEHPVQAVALDPQAKLLASGAKDGELRLWDVGRGVTLARFTQHHAPIARLVFSPDGRQLVATDLEGHTSAMDVATHALSADRPRSSTHESVWFGASGACVLASEGGWRILELDPQTLATRREIRLEQVGQPPADLLASDGRRLCAMAGTDLHIWDLATGGALHKLPQLINGSAQALCMTADGERLAVSDNAGRIAIVSVASGVVLQVLSGSGSLSDVAFDHTGEFVSAAGPDGVLRTWAVASGRLLALQLGHAGAIHAVAFGGARMLLATAGEDQTLRLWSAFGSQDHQVLLGHVGIVTRLALCSAGDRLVSVSKDGSLRSWDVSTCMPLATLSDYPHHVNALAIRADGRKAWSAYHDKLVETDLDSMRSRPAWKLDKPWILDLALAPDGATLLVATSEGCLLLDPATQRSLRELKGHHGQVRTCAFGEQGRVAYTGGTDGLVLRFDLRAGGPGVPLYAGPEPIQALEVAHDGASIYLSTGTKLQRRAALDGRLAWEQTSSSDPLAIGVLLDGTRVVTGHSDGSLVFWDAQSGAPMLVRSLGGAAIESLACDPQGSFIAAAGADGLCHILRAATALAPGDVLRVSGTRAATQLHAGMRSGLRTRADVLAEIDARTDLDPQMRGWLRTCEQCWLPMPWSSARAAYVVVLEPGLPAESYTAARRLAEAYLAAVPRDPMALATIALGSARLGDVARALAASVELPEAERAQSPAMQAALHAARALALHASAREQAAEDELRQLCTLAALPDAPLETVSLWRQAEAALAK